MIPAGVYVARALSFRHKWSKNGAPCVEVEFGIIKPAAHNAQRITHWLYFSTKKSSEIAFKALENAGWDGKDELALDGLGSVECELVVQEEEYDGKVRSKVQWVNKPGGGCAETAPPLAGKDADEFRRRLRAMRSVTGGAPAAAAVLVVDASNDDIPF